jgi:hypothetical protein
MPLEELSCFGIGRGHEERGPTTPSDLGADCLGSDGRQGDHEPFHQGYIAGWQSVRGADDQPFLIPPCQVLVGPAMYMVGFSRGARAARTMTPDVL